jgi:hypothetical protein
MKGTLVECLGKFKAGEPDAARKLATFCGVSLDSVSRWNKQRLPKGSPLNKLWYLLDANGYTVHELTTLHPVIKLLGEAVAFGAVNHQEAMSYLHITGHEQYLYRVLQGRLTPLVISKGELRLDHLDDAKQLLRLAKEDAFEKELIKLVDRLVERTPEAPVAIPPHCATVDPATTRRLGKATLDASAGSSADHHSPIVTMAAAYIGGVKPLLQHITSDGEEAIQALRDTVGDDAFYEVLDLLKSMSSRKARQFYRPPNP